MAKIERVVEKKFEPFTLTIETKEEADVLWNALNVPMSIIQSQADKYWVEIDNEDYMRLFKLVDSIHPVKDKNDV